MRAFVNGPDPETRTYRRFDFPSSAPAAGSGALAACAGGGAITNESVRPSVIAFDVSCDTSSPVVVKATYHPNWQATVDGVVTPTFMTSPSYIGIVAPAGRHHVVVEYRSAPVKTPLLVLGLGTIIALAVVQRRRLV
jgi:hypothetical protein